MLHRHPQIDSAVVVARHSEQDEVELTGYIVPKMAPPYPLINCALLGKSLPDYMVPSALVMLDEMPLTPNGKIDRKALPRPERAQSDAPHVAPRTPFETIWPRFGGNCSDWKQSVFATTFLSMADILSRQRDLFPRFSKA